MIFDTLCKCVELDPMFQFSRRGPIIDLRNLVSQARLFLFPYVPHEALPKRVDPKETETFHLPFPTLAVEDKASCVLIKDINESYAAFGLEVPRFFMECLPFTKDVSAFRPDSAMSKFISNKGTGWNDEMDGLVMLSMGILLTLESDTMEHYKAKGVVEQVTLFRGNQSAFQMLTRVKGPDELLRRFNKEGTMGLTNYITALEEVMRFSSKDNFIMEKNPIKVRPSHIKAFLKAGKILRSHERPLYTLLHPDRIREQMRLEKPEGSLSASHASPCPHERCGYYRTYRHERYKKALGKRQWIDPIWIGPSESVVGKHRYKVILDKTY